VVLCFVVPAGEEMAESWRELYAERRSTLEQALQAVQRGAKVFLGTACGEPHYLVQGLIDRAHLLHDVQVLHFIPLGEAAYTEKRFDMRFRHNAFFVGPNTRDAINQARADYTPVFISEIPDLFRRKSVPINVALVQTSPPDDQGFLSLGVSVDIVKAAVESADVVVVQVNRHMPRTLGESFIPIERVQHVVEHDAPLIEFHFPEPDEVGLRIARNAARLINDGDTLHIGFGHIPHAVLRFLRQKSDLGVHTEVISDDYVDLIEDNVLSGKRKSLHPGMFVCSFCIGTRKVYDYVADNPRIGFYPADYVYNPLVIAKNDRMVSIGSALEVDLSGQVCSESKGFHFYSGLGGRLDFIRGAAMSPGGKSIITLPSTTKDGRESRIRPHLQEGAGVVATRGDVRYIVTEYGIAYLHGKSVRERALALINIAHPLFRQQLLEEAKRRAYVYPDQILLTTEYHAYPEEEESEATLRDGTVVTVRPIKPTDESALQDFFYSHSDETIYRRYFRAKRALSHPIAQNMVNLDYRDQMAFVATVGEIGLDRIIGVGRYAADEDQEGMVEVAYTIHDKCRGRGLATLLQERLEAYAERMGFRGVTGYLFQDNLAMLKVFAKRGKYHKERMEGGILRVWRYFAESKEPGGTVNLFSILAD
jgi:acyl-CoA hydrolase/GNAT superfamily N-acetyltransferase